MVEHLGVALHDDVGVLDRARLADAVDERGDFVAHAEDEAAGRRDRPEDDVDRVREPAREELILVRRRPERASAPERELAHHTA